MIPLEKVKDIIEKHNSLEKELSSGSIDPKNYATKSKEYSNLGNIIIVAKNYLNIDVQIKELNQIIEDKKKKMKLLKWLKKI